MSSDVDQKNVALDRGYRLEELANSRGWEEILSYIQEKIATFGNRGINEGFKTMEEYQLERGKVLGLTSLVAEITTALDFVKNERAKDAGTGQEPVGEY